jgi:hypothetical protein
MLNKTITNGFCTKWVLFLAGVICFGFNAVLRADTDPKYYAVMVTAQVQSSPAQITLQWSSDGNATGYEISRNNGSGWNTVGSVGGGSSSWTDSNVSNGGAYEYRIIRNTSVGYRGTGYIYAGINAPLKDSRGKVILLVDNSLSDSLSSELKRMEWDLAGDGWTVLRHDVSRSDTPPNIKSIIRNDYYSDPSNVKAVYIFGHVPVPYSGDFNPDGHPDHRGAWVADTYYGDMDGNWSDSSVNDTGAERPYNKNSPGDGKFDQSDLPSDIEVAVGRVDFSNLTCFANKSPARSELDLARAYLNKDHDFRHRVFTVARRGLICDNWGERGGEAFAASGWRNFGNFFGADNVTAVGGWQYFPAVTSQDYLWSWGGGGGGWYTCDGVGSSDDFANNQIKTVFTMYLGSYFGDWDNESGFLRASLGSGYCLTTSWAGRPHWFYHHMGLGEPIGVSAILTQNNRGAYENQQNYAAHQVHVTLLGDPTLRMHPVIPPNSLRGSANGSSINLSWNASNDSDLQGYHVYRGGGPNGSFTRLTSSPINSTSFTDSSYSANATYMVRAVKLERSGSGTYINASQGIFYPENGTGTGGGGGTTGGGTPQSPAAPTALNASAASAAQINLSWQDVSGNEAGFRIERKTGANGAWSQVGTVGANAISFSNSGLSTATTYYYRVFAYNDAGSSSPSNESSATTSAGATVSASATFINSDASTKGSWKGVYGGEGYNVIGNGVSYPGYVTVNPSGKSDYQWTDSSADTRALQKTTDGNRIAGCWYSTSSFTVDFNFTDGNSHKLSLYFLDWDRSGRSQTVDLLDASSGALLDTRSVSNFGEGTYLNWNAKGSVRVRITKVSGANAVLMGAFFGPAGSTGGSGGGGSTGANTKIVFSNGDMHVQILGQPGQKFDLWVSENLSTDWINIATVTLTGNVYDFVDKPSTGKGLRFYRAIAIP